MLGHFFQPVLSLYTAEAEMKRAIQFTRDLHGDSTEDGKKGEDVKAESQRATPEKTKEKAEEPEQDHEDPEEELPAEKDQEVEANDEVFDVD